MTRPEFNLWWDDYATRFPETVAWLNTLGSHKEPTKTIWAEVLEDIALPDAMAANKRLSKGDAPVVKAFERDSTAAHVRNVARECRDERLGSDRRDEQHEKYKRGRILAAVGSLAKALERMRELAKDGATAVPNAMQIVLQEHPTAFPEVNEYSLRRYRCVRCLDSGSVYVWLPKAIALAKAGTLTGREGQLVAALFCTCSAAPKDQDKKTHRRYDDVHHCLCPHADTISIHNRTALVEWTDTAVERMPNYSPEFAEYSR